MAQERKIRCDCGKYLGEREITLNHVRTNALVCPNCNFTTLTKEQATLFQKRIEIHSAVDQEKQIIKIGNSMGITLPEKLREFGIKVGRKVRLEAINEHSFKVELG